MDNQTQPTTLISLKDLHEQFVKCKFNAEGRSQATIKDYRENFRLLLKFKPDIKLEDLTEKTIVEFLEYLNTRPRKVGRKMIVRPYKNSSIATVRGKLGSFFTWLVERGHIKVDPFDKISYPDVSYTKNEAFSKDEFTKICHAVNTTIHWQNPLIKKRSVAIINFLSLTGVRKEELLGLRLSDIDIANKSITVRAETSKSKRTSIIPMSPDLVSSLEDYLDVRENYTTDAFWVSNNGDQKFTEHGIKRFVNKLNEATAINCHLHRFRHTFAVNYYIRTNDMFGLNKLLGHKSFKMTLVYLRSVPNDHQIEQMQKLSLANFS